MTDLHTVKDECPKCHGQMLKHFSTVSGNAKYIKWRCDECEHEILKCTGVLS